MLSLSLFRHRMFALTSLVGLLVNVAIYGLIFVLSLYFQRVNGLSAFATGLAFVPMMAAVLPANLIAPRIAERIGAPATIAAGAVLSAVGCLAALGVEANTSYWAICMQLIAMSTGLGLLVPPLTSTLLGSVEKSRSGIAAGVLNATRQTGSVLGVALFGSLVGQSSAFMTGLHASLIISAGALLAAAAAIWWGRRSTWPVTKNHEPVVICADVPRRLTSVEPCVAARGSSTMPTVPIDRRDFLRRAALIGTALPVAGLARQARAEPAAVVPRRVFFDNPDCTNVQVIPTGRTSPISRRSTA